MSKRGYKEWARHLRADGKRAAAKQARRAPVESEPHTVVEEDEVEPEALVPCPYCGARNAAMGQLGKLMHYNCRHCGAWYSRGEK